MTPPLDRQREKEREKKRHDTSLYKIKTTFFIIASFFVTSQHWHLKFPREISNSKSQKIDINHTTLPLDVLLFTGCI